MWWSLLCMFWFAKCVDDNTIKLSMEWLRCCNTLEPFIIMSRLFDEKGSIIWLFSTDVIVVKFRYIDKYSRYSLGLKAKNLWVSVLFRSSFSASLTTWFCASDCKLTNTMGPGRSEWVAASRQTVKCFHKPIGSWPCLWIYIKILCNLSFIKSSGVTPCRRQSVTSCDLPATTGRKSAEWRSSEWTCSCIHTISPWSTLVCDWV